MNYQNKYNKLFFLIILFSITITIFFISNSFPKLIVNHNNPQNLFETALKLKSQGNYRESLKYFKKVYQLNPNYPGVNLEIGKFYFLGFISLNEALVHFTKEIELTNHPYAYHERGIIYGYLRQWDKAEKDFRQEIVLSDNWAGYLNLAWILFSQGEFNEAEKIMQIVNQKKPESIWSLNGLGVIHLNQGKYELAIQELEKAFEKAQILNIEDYLRAYPNNNPKLALSMIENIKAGIAFNLALAYEKGGDLAKALEFYNKTKEIISGLNYVKIAEGFERKSIDWKISKIYSIIHKNENQ